MRLEHLLSGVGVRSDEDDDSIKQTAQAVDYGVEQHSLSYYLVSLLSPPSYTAGCKVEHGRPKRHTSPLLRQKFSVVG